MENKFTDRIKSNQKLSDLFCDFSNKISKEYPSLKTSNTKYYFAFKGDDSKNKIWFSRKGKDHLIVKVRKNDENDSKPRVFTITERDQIDLIWSKIKLDRSLKIVLREEQIVEIFSKEIGEEICEIKLNYVLKMLLIDSKGLDFILDDVKRKLIKEYFLNGRRLESIDAQNLDETQKIEQLKSGILKISEISSIKKELEEISSLLGKYPHAKIMSLLDLIYGETLFSEIDAKIYFQFIKTIFKIRKDNAV